MNRRWSASCSVPKNYLNDPEKTEVYIYSEVSVGEQNKMSGIIAPCDVALMASAPALLDALERIVDICRNHVDADKAVSLGMCLDIADSAICVNDPLRLLGDNFGKEVLFSEVEGEPSQDWYFTFGSDHEHPDCYVVIHGTEGEARDEMVRRYGPEGAVQFPDAEDAGVEEFDLKEIG